MHSNLSEFPSLLLREDDSYRTTRSIRIPNKDGLPRRASQREGANPRGRFLSDDAVHPRFKMDCHAEPRKGKELIREDDSYRTTRSIRIPNEDGLPRSKTHSQSNTLFLTPRGVFDDAVHEFFFVFLDGLLDCIAELICI